MGLQDDGREFGPEDDVPDSDHLPNDHDRSRAPTEREREIYLSELVYRDGSAVTLEEVIVTEDPEPRPGDWPPDRERDPWGWEMWWRPIMRPGHVGGRFRGVRITPIVWKCEHCGESIDVKSKGRPPKFCSQKCRQAAYVVRVTKCPE